MLSARTVQVHSYYETEWYQNTGFQASMYHFGFKFKWTWGVLALSHQLSDGKIDGFLFACICSYYGAYIYIWGATNIQWYVTFRKGFNVKPQLFTRREKNHFSKGKKNMHKILILILPVLGKY